MEVTDISDLLNVRSIKMESLENRFADPSDNVESNDALSLMPQYVTESDLGIMQTGTEILEAPLAVFTDAPDEDDHLQSIGESSEVIIQLMDIRTRLSQLRTMLEKRLNTDLSEYSFWLQDAKQLESHKTLVEQCIRGSGVVQVNIQIRPHQRKINIMDVLKPDEELLQLPPNDELEVDMDTQTNTQTQAVESEPRAVAVKWMVDDHFKTEHAKAKIPDDPMLWSMAHVKVWIQWAVRRFQLCGVRLADWQLPGPALCALSHAAFREKVPSDPGDLFWTHFELLRKCQFIAVVQSDDPPPRDPLEAPHSAIRKKHKQLTISASAGAGASSGGVGASPGGDDTCRYTPRGGNNGQVQLWQFLLELLTSSAHYHLIRWDGAEGEFRLLEPERVARLWGARKHKPAMNYEKLSRALRYYYDGDMIAKVPAKRFVYKFVCDLRQLLGYGAGELAQLVRELHDADTAGTAGGE